MKKKLTKQQRRIAVLRDALKQIELKNTLAVTGRVIDPFDLLTNEEFNNEENEDKQAQDLIKVKFKGKGAKCRCCARGALLLSTINKENTFKICELKEADNGAFDEESPVDSRLLQLFSKRQILMMENAFETEVLFNDRGINEALLSTKDTNKSLKFGKKHKNSSDRLKAILKNCIKNKGIFIP